VLFALGNGRVVHRRAGANWAAVVCSHGHFAATVTDEPWLMVANVHSSFSATPPVPNLMAQTARSPSVHVRLAPLGSVSLMTTLLAVARDLGFVTTMVNVAVCSGRDGCRRPASFRDQQAPASRAGDVTVVPALTTVVCHPWQTAVLFIVTPPALRPRSYRSPAPCRHRHRPRPLCDGRQTCIAFLFCDAPRAR